MIEKYSFLRKFAALALVAVLATIGFYGSPKVANGAVAVKTEQYGTASDGTPLMWDVYTPDGVGPWPAVLVIHGGGFRTGDDIAGETVQTATDLANAGFIAFKISYRLAPPGQIPGQTSAGHYPDQTNDVKIAVLAARHDSRSTGKVGAVGGSAGGSHTVFVASDGTAGADKIDVGVGISGAYDFSDPISQQENPNFYVIVKNYVNTSDQAALLAASPISHVTANEAPLYLFQSQDDPMPGNQFTLLVNKLNSLGVTNFKSTTVPGSAHSFANWPVIKNSAIAFLGSVLKNSNQTSSFTFSVSKSGTGTGSIYSPSINGINCGSNCSVNVVSGTTEVLTAVPGYNSTFTGWTGGNCSGTGNCTVVVNSNSIVTANFDSTGPQGINTIGSSGGTFVPPTPLPIIVPPVAGCIELNSYSTVNGQPCPTPPPTPGPIIGPIAYNFYRDLSVGSTGYDVATLQKYLNTHGYTVAITGAGSAGQETNYFGSLTQAALIRFQLTKGISPAVGYFGPITKAKIQNS